MEENENMELKPSAGQSALYYGLLLSVALIVVHLVLFLTDLQTSTVGMVISFLVLISGVVVAQMDYRNKKWGGYISYGKAVKIGFLTVLFASFILAVYTYVYHGYINTSDILDAKLKAQQEIYNLGLNPDSEAQQLKIQEFVHTPIVYAVGSIFSYAFFGIVISLITSIFIKKESTASFE
jgi:hypothetical protein